MGNSSVLCLDRSWSLCLQHFHDLNRNKSEVGLVMSNIKIGIIAVLIGLLPIGQANAYTGIIAGTIIKIRVYDSETVLFKLSEGGNPDQCDGTGGWIMLAQEVGNEAQARQYSALLSARLSSTTVTIYLNGCSNGGASGYPLVQQIAL